MPWTAGETRCCAWAGMSPVPEGCAPEPPAALWRPLPVGSVPVKIALCLLCPDNFASSNSYLWNLCIC